MPIIAFVSRYLRLKNLIFFVDKAFITVFFNRKWVRSNMGISSIYDNFVLYNICSFDRTYLNHQVN